MGEPVWRHRQFRPSTTCPSPPPSTTSSSACTAESRARWRPTEPRRWTASAVIPCPTAGARGGGRPQVHHGRVVDGSDHADQAAGERPALVGPRAEHEQEQLAGQHAASARARRGPGAVCYGDKAIHERSWTTNGQLTHIVRAHEPTQKGVNISKGGKGDPPFSARRAYGRKRGGVRG